MISNKKIKSKMKALVLEGIGDLRLEEREIGTITQNDVLLEIKSCGICSSDIERIFVNGTYHFPTIPGHEFCGEIVGVYSENDRNLLGKKASVFPLLPCYECDACKEEEYAQCKNYSYFGSRCDGAYSQYLVVPKWNLVYFDGLDYDVAAMCEPASVALHALKRIDIKKNDKLFVLGSGTIGLLIGLFSLAKGYDVYIGTRRKESIKFIESLGLKVINTNNLTEEVNKATDNLGFKYIMEAVGTNEAMEQSILSSANFATIVAIGNPKADFNLPQKVYWKILRKQLTLTGTWNSSYGKKTNDWQEALSFMKENQEIFKKLITNTYSLEDYQEAFDLLRDKEKFKIKVTFKVGE